MVYPKFRKIAPASLPGLVATALKDAFCARQLRPGDAIVEREIARQMSVGTAAVREALISLQEQGFVRRVAKNHTFVRQFDAVELLPLCSLWIELESLAFRWARPKITRARLAELERIHRAAAKASATGQLRLFFEKNYAFHQRCWTLSRNVYLADTLSRLAAPLFTLVMVGGGEASAAAVQQGNFELLSALTALEEPEFSAAVRQTLNRIALNALSRFESGAPQRPSEVYQGSAQGQLA